MPRSPKWPNCRRAWFTRAPSTGAGFAAIHAAFEQLAAPRPAAWSRRAAAIANCHVALAESRKTIPGLRTVAFGDDGDCPPSAGRADLRVVA